MINIFHIPITFDPEIEIVKIGIADEIAINLLYKPKSDVNVSDGTIGI